jgi:hypothetical protein
VNVNVTGLRTERIFAGYFLLQAVTGIVFWVLLDNVHSVRKVFELAPANHEVTNAFFLADLLVGVVGSFLTAYALDRNARWALPIAAFTTGGIVYPTLYLVLWVSHTQVGGGCLAIMIPPSTLSTWITYQTWRAGIR